MNQQELKELTYKMVSERVNEGTKRFNSLVFLPIIYNEMRKKFSKDLCDMFRTVVYDTCILRPNWEESAILEEVASQFKVHGEQSNG